MSPGQKHTQHARRYASRSTRRKKKALKQSPTVSVEDLLRDARVHEASGNIQEAVSKLEEAVSLRSTDAALYEELASLYMQATRSDDADRALRIAISLQPESGFEKYAYLAQLLGNTEEAVSYARKGTELIRADIMSLDKSQHDRIQELRQYQASAHCATAEICLGVIEESNDPALAERMDVEVENEIMEALALSTEGSDSEQEALIALANLRLSQGREFDAKDAMVRVLGRMSDGLSMLEREDIADDVIVIAMESLPAMEIRIAVGKQLMEVKMWAEAESVLSSVMYECDFNVEVWYLLAITHWKRKQLSEARECLEQTRAILRRPDGYDGELDDDMVDRLYEELDKISDEDDVMKQ